VFRAFRALAAALGDIADHLSLVSIVLQELCAVQKEQGPAVARLETLEMSRHQWEANCEGLLTKAEGKLRAANNAESRERVMRKSYEHLIDPLDEIGVEPETATRDLDISNDVRPGETERLQALRLDVAPNNKTLAQRAKFGVR